VDSPLFFLAMITNSPASGYDARYPAILLMSNSFTRVGMICEYVA
jgi:hypothetical protein